MPELTKKQKRVLETVAAGGTDKELVIINSIGELEDKVEAIENKIEENSNQVIEEIKKKIFESSELVLEIDKAELKGDKGDNYVLTDEDKAEIALSIDVPVVEKVIEKVEVIKEQPIVTNNVTNEIKEVAVTDKAEVIVDKLESLKEEARLDITAIKGLDDYEETYKLARKPRKTEQIYMAGGGSNTPSPIQSVSNSDGTLTISPTTGAVIASLNLANANTWTGQQTFSTLSPIVSTLTATRVLYAGTSKEIKDDATFTYNDTTNILSVSRGSFTPLISDAYVDTAAVDPVLNGSPFVSGLTDWTFTSGWAYSATNGGSAKHTSGNTNVLSQTISISVGVFRLQYTLGSTGTSSSFKCRVDGVELGSSATSGTKTVYFSTFSGSIFLEFAPGSTQTRDLYDVIIFPIVASDPAIQFKDQLAVTTVEMRAVSRETLGIGNNTNANNLLGDFDIAIGNQALRYNVSGDYNVAIGYNSLQKCNSSFNTAIGAVSLESLTTGAQNFACGYRAGLVLTTGSYNTLLGVGVAASLTTANYNTLIGYGGASGATTGQSNTLLGGSSAQSLTTGSNNIFIGYGVNNAISTQSYCIAIGSGSASIFTVADYSMAIGNFISGINGSTAISTALGFGATSVATNRITAKAVGISITGATSITGTAVVGVGTAFTTELAVGNSLSVYNYTDDTYTAVTVATITDSTHLTLSGSVGSDGAITILKAGNIFKGYNIGGTSVMNVDELGRISTGLGTTASSAQLQSQSTTEQLRINYDASNYYSTTVGSTGLVTLDAVGSGSEFLFSDRVRQPGTFAEIYVADAVTSQSIPTGATYTKVTAFTTNGLSSNATADQANDKITLTKAGKYFVTGLIDFAIDKANTQIRLAVFSGGTIQTNIQCYLEVQTINEDQAVTVTGILSVTANTDIDLRIRHDDAGSVGVTIENANMLATYLGE